jgi:hypothetical protein
LNIGNVIDEKFTAPWAREFEKPDSRRVVPITSAAVPARIAMAEHPSTCTTQLYHHRRDELSFDKFERIVI